MEITVNIENYLSESEIKEIVIDQVRSEVSKLFKNEQEAQRLLSNLSYEIVFNEVDKVVPNSLSLITEKVNDLITSKDLSFYVFYDGEYSKESLGMTYLKDAIKQNKDLINQKVKDTITNHDYSQEIWNKFEELADTFTSNIYAITELGRNKKATE